MLSGYVILPLLTQIDADLMFSIDTAIPVQVRERWGFTHTHFPNSFDIENFSQWLSA
ncbi:MAG: hypothetical protein PHT48_05460 [Dechloromonas sp.]|nr:hypothetical protein [Dechloromonas sp.]